MNEIELAKSFFPALQHRPIEQFPVSGSGKRQKFKLIEKFQSGQIQETK